MIARHYAKDLEARFGLTVLAADMDDFDEMSLGGLNETQPCAFIISTYGDGDPPDSIDGLWSFLKSAEDKSALARLRYVIFGLGNSNYRQYNYAAKLIDIRLQHLGAKRLGKLGAGDDAHGNTETDFARWRKETQAVLQSAFGLTEQTQSYRPSFVVKQDKVASVAQDQKLHLGAPLLARTSQQTPPTVASVKEAQKLWETEDRLCLHLSLDLGADRQLKYKTGDHLAVWPSNPDHEVESLVRTLDCWETRHNPITVTQIAGTALGKLPCPSPTTVEVLLRYYLEICGRLSTDFVSSLVEFCPSDASHQRLAKVADDPAKFDNEIVKSKLTLAGLLRYYADADAVWRIPISLLLERLKPMQPRYYSISSSAVTNPRIATITAVVEKPVGSPGGSNPFTCCGLTTGYLWALEQSTTASSDGARSSPASYALNGPQGCLAGGKMYCATRQTSFNMPAKASCPIIMIGAGTGVAPFRAFVQERVQRSDHETVGKTLLFMGFRSSHVDYIYKDEWETSQRLLTPQIFDYWVAFSRDQQKRKTYVQDLIQEHATEVMNLLQVPGCRLFICGSAVMARDVVEALVQVRCEYKGCSQVAALDWVRKMRQFSTLLEDVWG